MNDDGEITPESVDADINKYESTVLKPIMAALVGKYGAEAVIRAAWLIRENLYGNVDIKVISKAGDVAAEMPATHEAPGGNVVAEIAEGGRVHKIIETFNDAVTLGVSTHLSNLRNPGGDLPV